MKRLLAFLIVASFGPGLMAQTYFGPNYIHKNSASNCFGDYTILDGSVVGSTATDHLIFTHLWGPDIPHENYMLVGRRVNCNRSPDFYPPLGA